VIGGGVAAASAAETLREEGADGSFVVFTREADLPYNRPPLSKGYLAGKETKEDALWKSQSEWDELNVEVLTRKSVMKVDAGERIAKLPGGEELRFGKLLLAPGANVRRFRVDGCDNDGINYLRAFGNSDAIRADSESADHTVLVGGSWIACEVAATLTALGRNVSMVCLEKVVTENHLGHEVARYIHELLESHGVTIHTEDSVERFEGSDGRVTKVVTEKGTELDAQSVVIGAGVQPDVMLAKSAGLEVGERGGYLCDAQLQTAADGIFIAGDAAEWESRLHGRHARVEHWDVAANHGKTAAAGMLGKPHDHDVVPYFWSDISDWGGIEYVGIEAGSPVVRGSVDDGDFTAIYVNDDGVVVGAATAGRSDDLEHVKTLIVDQSAPGRAALADDDLESLTSSS
jgi:3-phenylpropionate/trans-cinnamate dioxygenase ferredoxin reductase subunit